MLPPDIFFADTGTTKGRGAFAYRDFHQGEIVERAPVVILLTPFDELPLPLKMIVFDWGLLTDSEPCSALSLGYGAMYNHDNPANMQYRADKTNSLLIYSALRDIREGEELTVNYDDAIGATEAERAEWFKQFGMEPLTSAA